MRFRFPRTSARCPAQIRPRAIEIEVTDGNAAQTAAQLRMNCLADDAVHGRERADVDDVIAAPPSFHAIAPATISFAVEAYALELRHKTIGVPV